MTKTEFSRIVARKTGMSFKDMNDIMDAALETIEEHGEMTAEQRNRMRLASTWAILSSRDIVNTLFHDLGSQAVFENRPFERRLRDIDTVAQQGQGRLTHYEAVGQIMLGVPQESYF